MLEGCACRWQVRKEIMLERFQVVTYNRASTWDARLPPFHFALAAASPQPLTRHVMSASKARNQNGEYFAAQRANNHRSVRACAAVLAVAFCLVRYCRFWPRRVQEEHPGFNFDGATFNGQARTPPFTPSAHARLQIVMQQQHLFARLLLA